MRRQARRGDRRAGWGLASSIAAGLLLLAPGPVAAQSPCAFSLGGRPVAASSTDDPIPVSLNEPIDVTVTAGEDAVGAATFSLLLGPLAIPVWQTDALDLDPRETGTSTVERPDEFAHLGVGAFQVRGEASGCETQSGWILVGGRSPFTTVTGLVASAALLLGIGIVAWSLRAALAGRRSLRWAIAGGLAAGVGVLVLRQQFGTPITTEAAAVWTVAPPAVSGAVQAAIAAVRGGGTVAGRARADAAGAAPPSDGSAPGKAFARLECPEAVVAEQAFDLVVGIAPTPDPGIVSEPMTLPDLNNYTIVAQVIADGMVLADEGQSWRIELAVGPDALYPARTLRLRPQAGPEAIEASSIRALYSVDGQPIGLAVRPIAIVKDPALLSASAPPEAEAGVDLSLPASGTAPDLTVRIERAESQGSGRLLMQMLAADPAIDVPDAPLAIDLGDDAERFLRRIITTMNAAEGNPGIQETLRGIGLTVADQLPEQFWRVLRDVAAAVADRAPSVLILSAEAYVPWGLAVLDPPIDPDAPPFLAAQCDLGRWVLGQRRPKLPPPATLEVSAMAVVSGVYDKGTWQRLMEAEAEARDLTKTYQAAAIDATTPKVLGLLSGQPDAQVIHFAVHGNYDPEGGEDGLILTDGLPLDPLRIKGTVGGGTPFVFLNACQVGAGQEVLGDYAGIAEAFLHSGAAGVIAPLWSIEDGLARAIASGFYEAAYDGASPAAALRHASVRQASAPGSGQSAGAFAYQYFGHPALRLIRLKG